MTRPATRPSAIQSSGTKTAIKERPATAQKSETISSDGTEADTTHSADENDIAAAPPAATGAIIITSVPDSVNIIINDVGVGITPYHAVGFYAGIYEITLVKEGYGSFRKTVDLKDGGTEFITATLAQEEGYLYVASVPESAAVMINDTPVGNTPLLSKPLTPGIYRLRVESPGYSSYSEQLGIISKLTDSIQVSLTPLKGRPASGAKRKIRKNQALRRISLGIIAAGTTAAGIYFNARTKDQLTKEEDAYRQYSSATGGNQAEYDQLYSEYKRRTKKTDRYATFRNIFYTAGIVSGAGFAVSIPF